MHLTPKLHEFRAEIRRQLLSERGAHGHWEGRLSSSALSTATALFTLSHYDRAHGANGIHSELIRNGLAWLASTQNTDGGWGDTIRSPSNISTTALGWAAFGIPEAKEFTLPPARAEVWLQQTAGDLKPDVLARAITARYGKDRTFSVPILTMLALAGRLGPHGWKFVPQLPFELAACPFRWFQVLRLPVVSYALPALIAIGQVRHHRRPTWNPILRGIRWLVNARTLRKLHEIQPETGGYLEATPLTSFVCMSLIVAGQTPCDVVTNGVRFLVNSVREDGSWPIDTNLATWVSTLAVNALLAGPEGPAPDFPECDRRKILDWLLQQQYRVEHPYTHAAPGGWAWTDLPGGVPDADDTPGALLALARLAPPDERTIRAAIAGVRWLLDLQNADGGIPTFCRGWTGLPFDRSSADLTAHTLLAWNRWQKFLPPELQKELAVATDRAIRFLLRIQRRDGAWAPLWFGNHHAAEVENVTYGTSRVVRLAGLAITQSAAWQAALNRGVRWLLEAQNPDGGWGGRRGTPSSIEETALVMESLGTMLQCEKQDYINEFDDRFRNQLKVASQQGLDWLTARCHGQKLEASPIGFYFANLWYYEELYPQIYLTAALSCWK